MLFVNKLKVLTLMTCLVLVGQGFASNFWADHTSQPGTETIDGKTFYSITTAEELAWFALQTEVGTKTADTLMTINAILKNDIDLAGKNWTPICPGGGNVFFNGFFDGAGHSIKNLTIDSDSIYARYYGKYGKIGNNNFGTKYVQNAGFIGTLGSGTVRNVSIVDVLFHITNGSSTTSQISVGPVVGWKAGKNEKGVIATDGVIDFCSASGTIYTSGAKQGVGGLVGNAHSSTIKNSISYVNIYASGNEAFVGGIVGLTKNKEVKIESCVYAGDTLVSTGTGASVGAVAGKTVSGPGAKPTKTYFDINIPAVNGKNASGAEYTNQLNSENVACVLNGGEWDENTSECSVATDNWSVGLSGLSLNGSDGYKVIFNANGGTFASDAKTSKILAAGETVTADEIAEPTLANKKFGGWATSADATEPSENLGVSQKSKVVYAVWYDFYDVNFNWFSETRPTQVPKHGTVSVDGFTVPKAYESDSGKYYFTGWAYEAKWFKDEDYIIKSTDTIRLASIDVTQNIDLYAVWTKAKTFSVTFNATMHGTNDVKIVRIVNEGDKVSEPDTIITDPGYRLVGWFTDEECTAGKEYNFDLPLKDDLILYAKWELVDYTISYEMDGGTNAAGNPSSYNYTSNDIVLATPTKTGASFDGWFYNYNEESGEFSNRATQITNGSSGNKTLYAKWTPLKYTIHYLSGSMAAGTVDSDEKEYGVPVQLKDAIEKFAHKGCVQDGWSTTDMGEKAYDVNGTYEGNEDLMLYPHWACNTYAITYEMFNVPGAENYSTNPDSYTGPAPITLANANASDETSFFMDNWYKESTFKTTIRTIQDIDAPITVYARWYNKIVYNPGSNVSGAKKLEEKNFFDKTYTLKSSIDKYTRENYSLDGWSITDGGDKEYDLGQVLPKEFHSNLNLYPHWTPEAYPIVYHNVEGATFETPNPETYTVEDEFPIVLNEPAKVGFNFLGWFLSEDDAEPVDGIAAGSIGEANFYAKWELAPSPITVTASSGTFEYDGETHNASCSYEGVIPVGYSIAMVPSGSVQNVSEGEVTTSCAVTITDESGDDVTDQFTELTLVDGTISVVAKVVPYGAVTIYTDETGNRAVIDGTSSEAVSITDKDNVVVNAVTFNRTFPVNGEGENKMSTLTLPFSIEKSKVSGAEFYELNDVVGTKVRIWKSLDVLEANTPYIIRTTADHLTFTLDEGDKLTLNTEKMNNSKSSDGLWEIRGVYEYKQWTEGDEELGLAYGYTAKATNNLSVGKFAKNGVGAYIKPLRAYLLKTPEKQAQKARRMLAKSIASISNDTDSDELDVEIVDRETGETTIIGKLNKTTGEIKVINNWYDMKGRKLNSKPTTKGIYYFNGKRVMVK